MFRLQIFTLLVFVSSAAMAQDMIYYTKNKTDKWKVTDINPQYIKAVDVADTDMSYSTTLANVLFVFNKQGDFLVVPKLYDDQANADKKIKGFFQERSKFHDYDKIITQKNEVIICTYDNVEKDKIIYKVQDKPESIETSKIALVIFSTGAHKLFTSADKVYKILSAVQDKYTDLALSQSGSAEPGADNSASVAGNTASVADTSKGLALNSSASNAAKVDEAKDSIATTKAKEDDLKTETSTVKTETPTVKTETPPVKTETPPATNTMAKPGAVKELEPSTVAKLQNKALANIRQLGDYIQLICQKDTDPDELTKTIEQSMALFITDARIEVSSVNRATVNQFKVKDYLVRMSMLKYEKVDIKWYNIQYTSQLRKGPDGFYYGTIEFEQRFVGIGSDNSRYEDITRKSVEVVLKSYERNTGGQTTIEWDVFLGDIGVTVTKTT